MPLCLAVAEGARARGIPVVLDGGSWKPGMDELLPNVDIAICSDDFRPPGCRESGDLFPFLAGQGIRRIAITRGEGTIRYTEGDGIREIAVPQVKAVDTLGAGDIFHGAFCYRFAQLECPFAEALQFAAKVASFSCQYHGTRSWMEEYHCPPD
jgi:sugar/nucleoside kinase (ribokinase family)